MSTKLCAGIVGMPNVGKSTLFNALIGSVVAQAANYPFCTIDPNIGFVNVPDQRLAQLSKVHNSIKIIPNTMEFVDIAGIVKGASEGAGLGNKFLSNIRQTDAIVHVVRCFENDDIIHVDGHVDPARDIDVINIELSLSDLAQIEKRLERCKKDKKTVPLELSTLERVHKSLSDGVPARVVPLTSEERKTIEPLMLLTMKPMLYAFNVSDTDLVNGNQFTQRANNIIQQHNDTSILVSAQVESELSSLSEDDKKDYLSELGIKSDEDCGLKPLIRKTYNILGLQTYFTIGPQETRAWTIRRGYTAPQAAGVIHSDLEKGFIRADIISYDDLAKAGWSEKTAREMGLVRSEGKEYIMQEGDIAVFKHNG